MQYFRLQTCPDLEDDVHLRRFYQLVDMANLKNSRVLNDIQRGIFLFYQEKPAIHCIYHNAQHYREESIPTGMCCIQCYGLNLN